MRVAPARTQQGEEQERLFNQVWDNHERVRKLTVPPQWRRQAEEEFRERYDVSRHDLRKVADRSALEREFSPFALREVAKLSVGLKANLRPPRARLQKLVGRPPMRTRERRKNARLLAFVAERVVPLQRLLEGSLKPGRLGSAGVPWEALLVEWTRNLPRVKPGILGRLPYSAYIRVLRPAPEFVEWRLGDPNPECWIPSPEALKVEYYAAARNTHLAREFFTQFQSELDEAWDEFQRASNAAYREIQKGYGLPDSDALMRIAQEISQGRADEEQARTRTRISESESRAYQQAALEYYRANLTRKDLIRHHLWKVVLWKTSGSEEDRQRLETPLRPWFLREARREAWPSVVEEVMDGFTSQAGEGFFAVTIPDAVESVPSSSPSFRLALGTDLSPRSAKPASFLSRVEKPEVARRSRVTRRPDRDPQGSNGRGGTRP